MSVAISERAIKDPRYAGTVRVAPDGDCVRVTWYCGESYTFNMARAREAIEHLRALKDERAWLELDDCYEQRARVQLIGDDLHAEGSHATVSFSDLRRAIKLTFKGK